MTEERRDPAASAAEAMEPGPRFDQLAAAFRDDPSIGRRTGFGSLPGLRVRGRIFAMLVDDDLVVKLPKVRVDQLVTSGVGTRFDPGHGRLMKEWVRVAPDGPTAWEELVHEALAYVGDHQGH